MPNYQLVNPYIMGSMNTNFEAVIMNCASVKRLDQPSTWITQEMLKKAFLAGNSVYICIDHNPDIIAGYFDALDPIFGLVKECEGGRDVNSLLKGPVCHAGFKRLN
jgi:hypothetical protein